MQTAFVSVLGLLSISLCFPSAKAQISDPSKQPVQLRSYEAEPLVIERNDTRYHLTSDGTGFYERTVVVRIQGESTLKQFSVLSVPFAAKSERVEWTYARVKHSDGTTVDTPLTGAMEVVEPVTREAPVYSDLKQMQLPVRDLRLGDTLEWKAKVVRTTAEAPGEFWGQESFTRDVVTLSQTLELEVPKDKYVKVWSPKYKPEESASGGDRVYSWKFEQPKPTVGAEADAAKEAEKKRVRTAEEEVEFREGRLPDVAWTTFKSWEAVGAWYRGLESERIVPDAAVKAKTAQVVAGKATEQEKVQAIYAYVATQIHYIAVSFGIGRYQPHSAGDVLDNQYGDCKDKHTLLAAMLQAAGVQADAVLIGAGIRFNEAVPSPAAFNHLITRAQVNGKPVWLDTTAEVAPFGMLVYVTRDHQALVIPASGAAKVEKTPAKPPFDPAMTMDAAGTLDVEGTSTSRLTLTFRGDDEVILRSVFRQLSPAQYDQFAQQICGSMGYAGTASHLEVSRVDDTTTPLKVSFDYKREKAGDWPNLKTIPQLYPVTLFRPNEKEPPVQAIVLGVPRVESSHSAMKLPEGWTVEFPEAVHEKSAYATFDQTYRFEKGTMYAERRVEVLQDRVPVSDWKAYSKFVDKIDVGNEPYIQLIRSVKEKAAAAAGSKAGEKNDTGDEAANNEEAQHLVEKAVVALQAKNTAEARALLDQAKAINPNQRGLWGMYGVLSFQQGELAETAKDYEKELSLHPAGMGVYPQLVQVQLAMKLRREAMATLERWAAADPSDARPALQLGQMQLYDGKPREAAATAESALARTASGEKKEQLLLLLGRAQLKAGAREKGDETLASLLRATEDPDMMNNAAYELADAGLELTLAAEKTRAALDKMEQQSKAWTLDENNATLRGKSRMLQATWDTLGWIYFKEGKMPEAEEYIDAAWRGRQDAEVGRHKGEIAAAAGNKNAAVTNYLLADATYNNYDMMGVRTEPGAAQKELQARIGALKKGGAKTTVTDARSELQKMRSLPLGPAAGLKGVAEYKILVARDAVVRAEPTGSASIEGGEERLKKAKFAGFIPPRSEARLVMAGMLNCHQEVCEFVLEP